MDLKEAALVLLLLRVDTTIQRARLTLQLPFADTCSLTQLVQISQLLLSPSAATEAVAD